MSRSSGLVSGFAQIRTLYLHPGRRLSLLAPVSSVEHVHDALDAAVQHRGNRNLRVHGDGDTQRKSAVVSSAEVVLVADNTTVRSDISRCAERVVS